FLLPRSPLSTLFPYTTLFRSIPFLYILYVIGYLLLRYDIESVFHAFIRSYFLVYSLPVLFYFFLLGELERTNIYSIAYENPDSRSEEHTSELQSRENLVCRLL